MKNSKTDYICECETGKAVNHRPNCPYMLNVFRQEASVSSVNYEHADLILQEAASYGLRQEVEMFAKKYINQGYKFIDAYHMAFEDWIK